MKIYRRQLRRLIENTISENEKKAGARAGSKAVDLISPDVDRNIDAGEFPWPREKPWWANAAVAHGSWDKDKNIEYDLERRHTEYVEQSEVGISGQKKNIFDKSFFDKKFSGNPTGSVQSLASKSSAYAPPFLREVLAPRLWIAKELNRRENDKGREFYFLLKDDVKEMTDYNSIGGLARFKAIMFALQEIAGEDSDLLDKWREYSDKQDKKLGAEKDKKDIISGDDVYKKTGKESDRFTGVSIGDDSDLKVYTIRGESLYAYTGTPKEGWVAYKQRDLKKGKLDPTNKFQSDKLDKAYKANKLETNPMYAKKLKELRDEKGNLSEGLSRGSLYRRRYRRY